MIPNWLAKKRHETCARCVQSARCGDKITLLSEMPRCSLKLLHPLDDEIRWAKAWPESVPKVSGCCDSSLHPAF